MEYTSVLLPARLPHVGRVVQRLDELWVCQIWAPTEQVFVLQARVAVTRALSLRESERHRLDYAPCEPFHELRLEELVEQVGPVAE